jgi:hypothetical protein
MGVGTFISLGSFFHSGSFSQEARGWLALLDLN